MELKTSNSKSVLGRKPINREMAQEALRSRIQMVMRTINFNAPPAQVYLKGCWKREKCEDQTTPLNVFVKDSDQGIGVLLPALPPDHLALFVDNERR